MMQGLPFLVEESLEAQPSKKRVLEGVQVGPSFGGDDNHVTLNLTKGHLCRIHKKALKALFLGHRIRVWRGQQVSWLVKTGEQEHDTKSRK